MPRRLVELRLFLAAYVIYDAARWLFAGRLGPAGAGLRLCRWLLSNVYLAAQIVVVPLALVWLYRRYRPRGSRNSRPAADDERGALIHDDGTTGKWRSGRRSKTPASPS